jgi:chemosensory pili system protein ChpA (sensor histidine kinase/response regulator)
MSGAMLDLTALSWCLGEIRESLSRAEAALEQQLQSDEEDGARLRAARAWLHQAHGALQVVDLEGVAVITQEAEGLLDRIDRDELALNSEVVSDLSHAFGAIVEYLEAAVAGSGDSPVSLFPHYRALLALRSAERVEPADLYSPDLSVRPPRMPPAATLSAQDTARTCAEFERGLLGFLRNPRDAQALAKMHGAVDLMNRAHQGSSQRTFWWLATAFFDALRVQALPVDLYAKRLVARINLQMRRTLQQGTPIADRMLRDLLFLLARTGSGSALADEARRLYRLAGTVPSDFETPRYGLVDARALRQAREATALAKAAWEKYVRGSAKDLPAFAVAAQQLHAAVARLPWPGLQRLAGSMGMLRRALAAAGSALAEVLSLEVATALLFVEQALDRGARGIAQHDRRAAEMAERIDGLSVRQESDGAPMPAWLTELSQAAQDRLTTAAFVGELQANLRACEKALDAFFRDPEQRGELSTLSPVLRQVSGALRLLGHVDAADGADTVARQVALFDTSPEAPDPADCDRVAQSLGALGFFVASLQQSGRQQGGFEFSRDDDTFIARLGELPVAADRSDEADAPPVGVAGFVDTLPLEPDAPLAQAPSVDASAPLSALTLPGQRLVADSPAQSHGSLEQLLGGRRARVQAELDALRARPADGALRAALRGTLQSVRDEATLLDDDALRGHASDALAALGADGTPLALDATLDDAVARVAGGVQAQAPVALPDEDGVDAELLGIFLDEADEVLAAIDASRVRAEAAPADVEHMTTMRRGFHTLKGSSRMVGLAEFGEAAWAMEQVLNGWLSEERAGEPELFSRVADAHRDLLRRVLRLRAGESAAPDASAPLAGAAAVRDGGDAPAASVPGDVLSFDDAPVSFDALLPAADGAPISFDELLPVGDAPVSIDDASVFVDDTPASFDELLPAGTTSPDTPPLAIDLAELGIDAPEALPETLAAAFAEDDLAGDALIELTDVLDPIALEVPERSALDEIERLRRSLADAGDAVDADGLDDVIELTDVLPADEAFAPVGSGPAIDAPGLDDPLDAGGLDDVVDLTEVLELTDTGDVSDAVVLAESGLAGGSAAAPGEADADADEILIGERRLSAPLYHIYLDEARSLLAVLDACRERWRADPSLAATEEAVRAVHTLTGGSRLLGLGSVHLTADALERFMLVQSVSARALAADDQDDFGAVLDRLHAAIDCFASAEEPPADPGMVSLAEALADRWVLDDFALSATDAPESAVPAAPPQARPVEEIDARVVEGLADLADEIDAELAPVFIEEADELMPRIGEALRAWAQRPDDATLPEALMRLTHTVKGSARMAGAMRLGQLVHDMETRIEAAGAVPRVPAALLEDLMARHDQALALYEAVRDPQSAAARSAAQAVWQSLSVGAEPDAAGPAADDDAAAAPAQAPDTADVSGAATAAGPAPAAPAGAPAGAQQLIRVRADLLDRLVNEAGEVSIARARLDNELGGIRQSLGELSENVNRLRSQLREIELAADSQIQARNARSREADAQFDPLEFDRYTRFQELSRMLAESVSDVATVQQNAMRSLDEASRDLARQSQVTRDLQQNLMRIRMVQFGSISDRLFRVVRQAAKELDKRVHLDLKGAAAELDRGVLERMAGPLEHLLRNAVAHGVEPRAERLRVGKSETGEITLEVRQEGNEVILTSSDDGAGLNYERIRARAIERGLIEAGAPISERELGQLIFVPGFSTATEVTTLAGRGVGMDVVRAEVAAMGGRIELDSTPGRGTRLTVHLPVSLAVAQVVLLTVGKTRIAIASALIEQVLQLKPEALAAGYAQHALEWQGQPVPLYFFGSLLELPACTPLAQRYSPVVVLRSGNERIALHVDHLAPSQEVVVKHVGPQLARLTGMAGATVLGNGEIVLILNPVQIAATGRGQQAGQGDTASFAPTRIEVAPTVMVVDDSVTVRKVTQRLLVREGYQVMLAKDGVDAMRQLQDAVPDVMLLDIEMPRMDGFDLTRNLRGDARWRGIPIVMITSRTADKHRNHALSLGVDVFLGKPFDEAELLRNVRELLARRQPAV